MTRPFSVVLDAFEVALAISFLLSLRFWGEHRSILGASDGTRASLVRYLRGFSRRAPSGIRKSSRKLQIGAAVEFLQAIQAELGDPRRGELSAPVPELLLDTINDEGEAPGIHVALVCCSGEAPQELAPI